MPFPHEHLSLDGQAQEARVQVAREPVFACLERSLRWRCRVLAVVAAEQHDLRAVLAAPEQPRLVVLSERTPEVTVTIGPDLRLEAPAPVRVPPKAHERASPAVPGPVLQSMRMARPGSDLRSHAVIASAPLLVAGRREVVDEVPHLVGRHSDAVVDHRQLADAAVRRLDAVPVEIPDDTAARPVAERADRLQAIDRQLAHAL